MREQQKKQKEKVNPPPPPQHNNENAAVFASRSAKMCNHYRGATRRHQLRAAELPSSNLITCILPSLFVHTRRHTLAVVLTRLIVFLHFCRAPGKLSFLLFFCQDGSKLIPPNECN